MRERLDEKNASAQTIRRHRLTERLFADVLQTPEEIWERDACELEDEKVLSEEAVSAICAFLGHPPACPHGRPIPPGPCCQLYQKEIRPFVVPLVETEVGKSYKIAFITPKNLQRLDRLTALGLHPGNIIRIQQKRPCYLIRIGETEIAIDQEIAREIYLKTNGLAAA